MAVKATYTSPISSKGQVTIPQEIRNRLGVGDGDRIEFVVEDDRTVIRPFRNDPDPFEKFCGILGPFPDGEAGSRPGLTICAATKINLQRRLR
jgi:antitoxin PrlF